MSKVWKIQSKSGFLRSRYEGTKEDATKWAKGKYIKGSFKIAEDKEFKWKDGKWAKKSCKRRK
jgi:hypothetical protein